MDKKAVFEVELSHGQYCTTLNLPATDYELLDALDALRMQPPDAPEWEMTYYEGFPELADLIENAGDLYEVNALAKVMAEHNCRQDAAFEALIKEEIAKKYGVISMETIYNLACSADCCHVLNLQTDEQLGRFYVENDFVPELAEMPEQLMELLNYAEIGRRMRQRECGAFAGGRYVTQAEDLKKTYDRLDLTLRKPDYAVALEISVMDEPERTVILKLPLSEAELETVLEQFDTEDISYRCADCRIPSLADSIAALHNLELANEAACQLADISEELLPRYKALVEALDGDVAFPLPAADEILEDYTFYQEFAEPDDYAKEVLSIRLGNDEASVLFPYVNLYGYGKALIEWENAHLTAYGLIERADFEPIMAEGQMQSEMQML